MLAWAVCAIWLRQAWVLRVPLDALSSDIRKVRGCVWVIEIPLFTFGILLLATHLLDTVRFEVAVSGLGRICCTARRFTTLVVVSAIHVNLGNVRASSFQANS